MVVYLFPGQGSQYKGMGSGLFEKYEHLAQQANSVVGYSVRELCLEDPDGVLDETEYTQVALFVVNAFRYLERVRQSGVLPDALAGHSIGEYNALFAGGAFDFTTGVELVAKRGALMGRASGGSMAAVLGLPAETIDDVLASTPELDTLEVSNYNTPTQTVLSGPESQLEAAVDIFESRGAHAVVPLRVSAAFHSAYMSDAAEAFKQFLAPYTMARLKIPVIANDTARPYEPDSIKGHLGRQIDHSVRWADSVRHLLSQGDPTFIEIGDDDTDEPGILTKMVREIRSETAQPVA